MSSVIPIAIIVVAALLALGAGALVARRRGYLEAGEVVARCGRGHFFTTTWNRKLSRRELSLGWTRLQRCPVGDHWSFVRQVQESELTSEQKREARQHRDQAIG